MRKWIGLGLSIGLVVVAGCGGKDGGSGSSSQSTLSTADSTAQTTTEVTTTTLSREGLGLAIAEDTDPGGTLPYMNYDPQKLAEVASSYCVELERVGQVAALRSSAAALKDYFLAAPVDTSQATDIPAVAREVEIDLWVNGQAALNASLLYERFADAAVQRLCPELSADRYLPEN